MKFDKTTNMSIIQWFVYLLANSIAIPIVIGAIFQLDVAEVSSLMQRMFFVVGISSFLQAKYGHRYPIADGPAGSWVSIFVIYAGISAQQGISKMDTLQTLSAGLLVSGLLLLLLGVTKWVKHLLFLFTPIVTGSFLFILALQLSGVFLKGMAFPTTNSTEIDYWSLSVSLLIFSLILLLSIKGKGWLRSYAILIGISVGWIVFVLFEKSSLAEVGPSMGIQAPDLFVWGIPHFTTSIVITSVLFTFLLISNTIAAISSAEKVVPEHDPTFHERLYGGTKMGGLSHVLATMFSTIAVVPLPATAGFVQMTRQYRIVPFLVACSVLMGISFFPNLVGQLASLPLPVASAALLATLIEMYKISIRSLTAQPLSRIHLILIGVPIAIGISPMFIPGSFYTHLPIWMQYIGTNGLLLGTIIAIVLEQTVGRFNERSLS